MPQVWLRSSKGLMEEVMEDRPVLFPSSEGSRDKEEEVEEGGNQPPSRQRDFRQSLGNALQQNWAFVCNGWGRDSYKSNS